MPSLTAVSRGNGDSARVNLHRSRLARGQAVQLRRRSIAILDE